MKKHWHEHLSHGPILLFLFFAFPLLYVYAVMRSTIFRIKTKLSLVIAGFVAVIIQSLLWVVILRLSQLELVLPPWSDKILVLWTLTVGTILFAMLFICRYTPKSSTKWFSCLSIMVIFVCLFTYLAKPIDYFYALIFREKMNAIVFSLDADIDTYKEYGNYVIAGKIQSSDIQNTLTESNHVILAGYRITFPKSFEERESPYFLTVLSSDNASVFFSLPIDYLENREEVVTQCSGYIKSDKIQAAYNFANNYELIQEMLTTTFDDVQEADCFETLLRNESLYVAKVTASGILPPVYEFNNGSVKGFLGKNKAIVFDNQNQLLFDVGIKCKNSTNITESMTETLKRIVLSIQKVETRP